MDELLGGSLFFLYLLSVVTVINYGKFNSKQKMSVLYILTYGIGFNFVNSNRNIWALIVSFLCAVFMYEEYWNCDEYKNTLIRHFTYKILDYLYYFVFIYKGHYFLVSLFVLSYLGISKENSCVPNWLIVSASVLLLVFSIHKIFSNPVEHFSYTEIVKKIENNYPYYILVDNIKSGELEKRMRLLADIEDRFFFKRKSYTFLSREYIKLYIEEKRSGVERRKSALSYFKYSWKHAKGFGNKIRLVRRLCIRIVHFLLSSIVNMRSVIKRLVKRVFSRGHSTIEMQLFRTLSYKRGIKIGKPQNVREFHNMIVRKIYEVIFTHVFFEEVKRFFLDNGVVEFRWFRQYIIYLYMHTVIAWYNGKRYMPMDKLFDEEKISEWEMEKLFIECLGLSCKGKIGMSRVLRYYHVIEKYELNVHRIMELLE